MLLLVTLGLWGRSYGRWDEVEYWRGVSVSEKYRFASTDGSVVWWADWRVRDPAEGPPTDVSHGLSVRSNGSWWIQVRGLPGGPRSRVVPIYGDPESEPWVDSRAALAGGWAGFSWVSGSSEHESADSDGKVLFAWTTRRQTGTAPWWAVVAALCIGPIAWVVSRRRAGRRVVPRPTVSPWMRRPARVGLVVSAAGCAVVLLVWAVTLFYSIDGSGKAFGIDGWFRLFGGGSLAGWRDARAADDPDAPNAASVRWEWLGWWAWYDLNESDVPSLRGLRIGRSLASAPRVSLDGGGIFGESQTRPIVNADGSPVVPWPMSYGANVPLLVPAGLLAIWPLAAGMRRGANRWATRRRRAGRCPACGYDLRASPERCPECGRPVGGTEPTAGRLPLVAVASLLLAGGLIYPMVANDSYGSWNGKTLAAWDWQRRSPPQDRPTVTLTMAARQLELSWKRDAGAVENRFEHEANLTGQMDFEVAGFSGGRDWTAIAQDPPSESEEWDSDQWDAWRENPATTRRGELRQWSASGPAWVVVVLLLLPIGWWGWRSARRSGAVAAPLDEAASQAGV